jgi:PAS domain S-box-containing protein
MDKNLRILLIDDNQAIHADFLKILCRSSTEGEELAAVEELLFSGKTQPCRRVQFEVDSAYQGQEAMEMARQSVQNGRPYALAFLDVRMPPGWDGVETAARLWEVCPDIQIVICTAYSDYSLDTMAEKLGASDQLLILKKPFDSVEVLQLANALTEKWHLQQCARLKLDELESLVQERTRVLQETNATLQAEIAERQRATVALRESEERYQLLFSKNPLPMLVTDAGTLGYLAVNETAARVYGYSVEEFLTMNVRDMRVPEEVASLAEDYSVATGCETRLARTKHLRKDGGIIDVEVISRTFSFAGRQAYLSLANDITERKAAEDRIREQAMLLDLAHDAILVHDLEGRVQFWNKGAEGLYGWSAAEAVGRTMSWIFPLDHNGATHQAETALLEKGAWSGQLTRHNRAGQEVVVDSRWTLLRDQRGQARSVLVINTDITEKIKLEAQFLRSQRLEGIGTLATGMAHDLNNILAPILMSADTLRWELDTDEREQAINRIEKSVKRGADIIQQVLTFGRGVSGERVAVDPGALIEEVAKIAGQTFPKDIGVVRDLAPGLWPIIGDKTQLHQLLLNLAINARDAMPRGGQLSLRAQNLTVDAQFAALHAPLQAGSGVMLQVADNGEGIPEANLQKIFDPFFTTKEIGKGTGLGLSTVLGIVKSHHGVVTVESQVGRGTVFSVILPATPLPAENEGDPEAASLPRGLGEIILVVDDEANVAAAARRILETHGYKVLAVGSAREALALYAGESGNIAAVLTDIMMPGMDGIALIRGLRQMDPRAKIIASSGLRQDLAGSSRAGQLEGLGINGFLAKPYTPEKLLRMLRDLLKEIPQSPGGKLAAAGNDSAREASGKTKDERK